MKIDYRNEIWCAIDNHNYMPMCHIIPQSLTSLTVRLWLELYQKNSKFHASFLFSKSLPLTWTVYRTIDQYPTYLSLQRFWNGSSRSSFKLTSRSTISMPTCNLHIVVSTVRRPHFLRVTNDLLRAVDQHHEAVLVLLDLSAAFDTIDHGILLQRLTTRYGITSSALAWFTSYLKGRVQTVNINGTLSEERALRFGVPQGSVIGPILFTMYSAPLQDIITQHGLKCVMYADDTQLYVIFHPSDKNSAMQKLVTCVNDIKVWSTSNKLKFNDSKTEVMFFASRFVPTESLQTVNIGSSPVTPKSDVRNLGVMLDNGLCMTKHVSNVCRSAAMAIYKIGQIRKYLDLKTTERLIHAFVTSRLDYCNCLLYGLPQYELSKLQRIQNSAARLTSRKRDDVESVLQELHWLPIAKRIEFKILLITYKCLHGLAPMY